MSYQALYRAWRPRTFSEICDQDAVVRTLRRQVWTVPLRWMVACIAAAAVLSVLCWAAWRLITPAQTLGHGLFGIWS